MVRLEIWVDTRLGGLCKSQQKSWNLPEHFWKEQLERRKTGRKMWCHSNPFKDLQEKANDHQ